jgi:acyl-CoA thioester hydrolase
MSADDVSRLDLTKRDIYPVWAKDVLRFGDTDRLGHINNAVFCTFFETGRVAALFPGGISFVPAGVSWVLRRITLDYQGEIHWPNEVHIGTVVTQIGTTSVQFGQGLFVDGACRATAETVTVLMDLNTRKSTPIPHETRAALIRQMV